MKKQFLTLLLFLFAFVGAANAAPTVTCSSPANGSTQGSSVTFNCSATTNTGTMTGWNIYIDEVSAWSTPGPATSISQTVTGIAVGTRNATVKAWDSTGAVGQLALTFNVSAAGTVTVSCSIPASNGTYTSPVPFSCSATGGTITGWEVYQNSTNVTPAAATGASWSGNVTMSSGTGHTIQVKAFNSIGVTGTYTASNVTVQAPSGGGSTGGGTVTFDQTLGNLTKDNTPMHADWNTNASWGWSSWHNGQEKSGRVSDTIINSLLYSGATTKWYMYHEPWFNQTSPTTCSNTAFTNPYSEVHSHAYGSGHRCVGYNNNTDAQVIKQIEFIRLAGVSGVNINVYGPDHESGTYDAVTKRFRDLGKNYSPEFEVMMNWDGGGARLCARGGSWTGTGVPNSTYCKDAYDFNTAYSDAILKNDNCAALPWLDPNTNSVSVSTDQGTCFVTKHVLSHIAYYYDNFFKQSNYAKWNGRPIYTFFGDETIGYYMPGNIGRTMRLDYAYLKEQAAKYFGNPLFIFRQSSGFSRTGSDGAYIWTVHEQTTTCPSGATYSSYAPCPNLLGPFYDTGKASGKLIIGSTNPSFDNHEASWGAASTYHRRCGQSFLYGLDQINAKFNTTTQLPIAEVATLNDHEEGSGVEMGLETCWRISSATTTNGAPVFSGTDMTWTLNAVDPDSTGPQVSTYATTRTINRFRVWISDGTLGADSTRKMGLLVDGLSPDTSNTSKCYTKSGSNYTVNLSCHTAGLASGTYYLYVEMVGGPYMQNQMSATTLAYTVTNGVTNQKPVGAFDHARGSVSGSSTIQQSDTVVMTGWAADNEDKAPITKVEIYEGATLKGTATLGISRPDVAANFQRSDWTSSGWTFTLSAASLSTGSHTYTAKAYDSAGQVTTLQPSVTVTITVAPTAVLALTPTAGAAPLVVTAETSSSAPPSGRTISSRQVSWGDGSSNTLVGTSGTHTYSTLGTYTVTLTITDSVGATATSSQQITVAQPNSNSVLITSLNDGAYVYSPIRVKAVATVTTGVVTKVRVYIDGVLQTEVTPNVNPATIDQYVFATTNASHTITVGAVDSSGNEYKTTYTVYVLGTN